MTRRPENISAVIFDLGATLIEPPAGLSEEELIAADAGCQEELISQASLEFSWSRRGGSPEDFVRFLAVALADRGFPLPVERVRALCDKSIHESVVQSDAIECLSRLRTQGKKIAIVSNSNPLSHDRIKLHGLRELVDVVRLSCDTGLWKPDPRAYMTASEALDVAPGKTLIIGDRIRTLALGAIGLGMPIALLDRNAKVPMLGEQLPFFAIFRCLQGLWQELGKQC